MSDPIVIKVGAIGQFAISHDEALALQAQLTRKLGARLAAVAQFVVEPTIVEDKQMPLDLGPAPAINHFDMSTQVFHD